MRESKMALGAHVDEVDQEIGGGLIFRAYESYNREYAECDAAVVSALVSFLRSRILPCFLVRPGLPGTEEKGVL
jgi:hypothetical protein